MTGPRKPYQPRGPKSGPPKNVIAGRVTPEVEAEIEAEASARKISVSAIVAERCSRPSTDSERAMRAELAKLRAVLQGLKDLVNNS